MMEMIVENLAANDEDLDAALKLRSLDPGEQFAPNTFDLEDYINLVKGCPNTGVISFCQLMKSRTREAFESPWHLQFAVGSWSGVMRDFLLNVVAQRPLDDEQYWSFRKWKRVQSWGGNPQGDF